MKIFESRVGTHLVGRTVAGAELGLRDLRTRATRVGDDR